MIKAATMARLQSALDRTAKAHGITTPLKVEQGGEGVALVEFSEDLHAKHHAQIDALEDAFVEDSAVADSIADYTDENHGRKTLRKGDLSRWLLIEVAEDEAYASPDDEKVMKAMQERVFADYDTPDPKTGLLRIPPPRGNAPTEVYLPLRYEPFDAIRSGAKKTEFRAYTPHYVKMLLSTPPKTVKFQRGYGAGAAQMVWTVKNIDLYDMNTRRSASPASVPKDFRPTHIAIDLGARLDKGS